MLLIIKKLLLPSPHTIEYIHHMYNSIDLISSVLSETNNIESILNKCPRPQKAEEKNIF